MRKSLLAAAALALLAPASWGSAPAHAMPLSAASALKAAGESLASTDKVGCWDDCYYGPPREYYRPYHRRYYYDRPYVTHRYYDGPRYYARPWWLSGPYYAPRPRYYIGPNVYWY
jgi:hypothetical protein